MACVVLAIVVPFARVAFAADETLPDEVTFETVVIGRRAAPTSTVTKISAEDIQAVAQQPFPKCST